MEQAQKLTRSYVTDMGLSGYVAGLTSGHAKAWALNALDMNPSITGALKFAKWGGDPLNSPYGLGNIGQILEQNEFSGKHLTGIAFLYATCPTPELKAAGDRLVEELHDAQCDDGYLGVHAKGDRLGEKTDTWDVWGHYHVAYGLLQWYKVTGNQQAFQMALAAANRCLRQFEGKTYAIGSESVNYAIGHLYGLLYLETKEEKYLREAEKLVTKDWLKHGNWMNDALAGKELYQSDLPRWEVLHAIMALSPLYEITGKKEYYEALRHIWWSVVKTDRHNTGGFTSAEAATGNPYAQGSIETCSCVAWVGFGIEYLRLSKDAYAADELELTYFNSLLASITDGLRFISYDTPMNGTIVTSQESLKFLYSKGAPEFNCCQANACRAMGEVSQWAAMTDGKALYLNYYAPAAIHTRTPGGQKIILRIKGDYPLTGNIQIIIEGLEKPEEFDLALRIPSWSVQNQISVNGEKVSDIRPGAYRPLRRVWQNGDQVHVGLTLSLHYWVGEDRFAGKTSVYRGPILLAADSRFISGPLEEVTFTREDLEGMTVQDGADAGCWLKAQCKNGITLIDFASAGKHKAQYITWLNAQCGLSPVHPGEGSPVWLNGLKASAGEKA